MVLFLSALPEKGSYCFFWPVSEMSNEEVGKRWGGNASRSCYCILEEANLDELSRSCTGCLVEVVAQHTYILDKTYTFAEKKKTFVQLTPCFLCLWMCQSMCRSQHFQRKQLLRCGSRARLWLVVIMICEWRFCVFNLHQNSNLKIPMFVLSPTFEQDPSQENPVWCSQNDAFDILNFVIFRRHSAEMWSNCCDWRLNSEMSEHRGSQR